jgi:hypothetical protein
MNSSVIDSVRGINRIEACLDNQQAAGLCEVNPAELEAVEGGMLALILWAAVATGQLHYPVDLGY